MNFSALTEHIESGVEAGLHTAAQVYVSRRGEVLLDEVFPASAALSKTDAMLWMSAGKPITAAAVLGLAASTDLDLDDPVAKWVPEFGVLGKEVITIEQLLTHTGGFRSADMNLTPRPFDEALATVCAARLEPRWIPGEKAGYHMNSSWIVLAAIVEQCAARPFTDYVCEKVLDPAGMRQTRFLLGQESPARVWDSSTGREGGQRSGDVHTCPAVEERRRIPEEQMKLSTYSQPEFQTYLRPGSNVCGPASDLGRFYETILLNPERIQLPVSARNRMVSRVRGGMKDATFRAHIDWGLGVIVNSWKHGGEAIPYGYGRHASDETFGHGGSQCSVGFADPVHGLAVAIVFDGMPGDAAHQVRMRGACEAVYEGLGLV